MSPVRLRARWIGLAAITFGITSYLLLESFALGGKESLVAIFLNRPYYAVPARLELGRHEQGATAHGIVTIRNRSDRSIRIVGASEWSLMTVGEDLPISIPPGDAGSFRVAVTAHGEMGRNVKKVHVFCVDQGRLTAIEANLSWFVFKEFE